MGEMKPVHRRSLPELDLALAHVKKMQGIVVRDRENPQIGDRPFVWDLLHHAEEELTTEIEGRRKHGHCTAVWDGQRCSHDGPLVKHHHYRTHSNGLNRGPPHHQYVCKACHTRAHEKFKGANGGPDDKWPDDPRWDGINAPFVCGDLGRLA